MARYTSSADLTTTTRAEEVARSLDRLTAALREQWLADYTGTPSREIDARAEMARADLETALLLALGVRS